MKILDLDMDYFTTYVMTDIAESITDRLSDDYGEYVWTEDQVRTFLEENLGLSTQNKIPGRIVKGHNEALTFWKELIASERLEIPFEVIHVDSHADLGLGYDTSSYLSKELLGYPVAERQSHEKHENCFGKYVGAGIGDYLLYAIAYRWISRLVYCANPNGQKNDYVWSMLKDFHENYIWNEPVENPIQLLFNPEMKEPDYNDTEYQEVYLDSSKKEPVVPFLIIPTIEAVHYEGDFDYVVFAQSPNYTPMCADFIIDIIKDYISEI